MFLLHPYKCALILILLPVFVGSFVERSGQYQNYQSDLTMDEEEYDEEENEEDNLEAEGYHEVHGFQEDIALDRVRRSVRDLTDTDTSGSVDNEDIIHNATQHKVR